MDLSLVITLGYCILIAGGFLGAMVYKRKEREKEYIEVEATIVDVEKVRTYTERGSIVKYVPVYEYTIADVTKRKALSKNGVSKESLIEIGKKHTIKVSLLDNEKIYESDDMSIAELLQNPTQIITLLPLLLFVIVGGGTIIRMIIELIILNT